MLDALRKSASGIVVKLLLALLILSFAAWGIGDVFSSRAARGYVASVGDVEIGPQAFKTELNREVARLKPMLGEGFTAEQARTLGLGDAVLRRMINTELYNLGARDLGLGVSDAVVLSEIHRSPEFFDENGKFNRFVFEQRLISAGLNEAYYVQVARQNLARQQYLSPLRNGVHLPGVLAEKLYRHAAEKRTIDYVRITGEGLAISTPDDSDIETFYNDNQHLFMTEEQRTFSAVTLTTKSIAATLDVNDEALGAFYEERMDEFTVPEKRRLNQILVADEITAEKAFAARAKGADFMTVAKEAGVSADTVAIGSFSRDQLLEELQEDVFSASAGETVGPLKTVLGWHVVEVAAIEPATTKPLAAVRTELETLLREERALDALFDLSNQLEDRLGGGATLEEAARDLGLSVSSATINASGEVKPTVKADVALIDDIAPAVFALGEGQDTPLSESKAGDGFFIARLDEIHLPQAKPLADVKRNVTQRWLGQSRADAAEKAAEALQGAIAGGKSLKDAAAAAGLQVVASPAFDRQGQGLTDRSLPSRLVTDVFALKPGEVTRASGTNGHVVAVLKAVMAADDNNREALGNATQAAISDLQSDLLDQLSAALGERHGININQSVLDQAY